MSYTPANVDVYVAAFAGAMSGMGVSGRALTSSQAATYTVSSNQAGAFAQQFDTLWAATTPTTTELTIEQIFMSGSPERAK